MPRPRPPAPQEAAGFSPCDQRERGGKGRRPGGQSPLGRAQDPWDGPRPPCGATWGHTAGTRWNWGHDSAPPARTSLQCPPAAFCWAVSLHAQRVGAHALNPRASGRKGRVTAACVSTQAMQDAPDQGLRATGARFRSGGDVRAQGLAEPGRRGFACWRVAAPPGRVPARPRANPAEPSVSSHSVARGPGEVPRSGGLTGPPAALHSEEPGRAVQTQCWASDAEPRTHGVTDWTTGRVICSGLNCAPTPQSTLKPSDWGWSWGPYRRD